MLIQPMFVDQGSNLQKIKGLGENYGWSQNTILRSVEKDLKKRNSKFSFIYSSQRKTKNYLRILVFTMR